MTFGVTRWDVITPFYPKDSAMASYEKRGAAWRASVVRRGQRRSATFDSRAEAEAWAVGVEAAILSGSAPAVPAASGATVTDLFDRYAREVSPGKGSARWETTRLRTWPARFPLFAGPVTALDGPALADWRDARLRAVASSTVNRELNLISAVMNRALKEWRVPGLAANPVRAIQRPVNPPPRTRMVSDDERALLLRQLGWTGDRQPVGAEQWIAWAFCLALETAMRKGEILGMRWQHVHIARQVVHLARTKNGYARDVPLSAAAVALFRLLKVGEPGAAVVPLRPGTTTTLFGRARDAARIDNLRFHDSRRVGATALAAKLDNVMELAASTGHRSLNILRQRYYQPDASAIAKKLG